MGASTRPGADGTLVALEVHYLAPTTQEGSTPSDLQPGSTMTNANVGALSAARVQVSKGGVKPPQ